MKNKGLRKIEIILGVLYLVLTLLFVWNLLSFPKQYEKKLIAYTTQAEKDIDAVLTLSDNNEIINGVQELVNQYPMEIIITVDGERILETVDLNFSYGQEGVLNSNAVAFEKGGQLESHGRKIDFWYAVYQMPDSVFVGEYFNKQIILNFVAFVVLSLALFFIQRLLIAPLYDVKKAIEKMDHYDFDLEMQQSDDIRSGIQNFASKLSQDIQKISMDQTVLNSQLQQEETRLNNAIMISRGLIHELKNPLYQTLHRNQDLLNADSEEVREIAEYNIQRTDLVLYEINGVLATLKDAEFLQLDEEQLDFTNLLHDEVKGFKHELALKKLLVDLQVSEGIQIVTNKVCLQMLIRNLLMNCIQYANPHSDVTIQLYEENQEIILSCENNSTRENLERMKGSEYLLNVVATENKYSSGNGLFIIKNLTSMLNGRYSYQTFDDKVEVRITFPKNPV